MDFTTLSDDDLRRAFLALDATDDGEWSDEGRAIAAEVERRNLDI